jgi:GNAT superfamily N-acetyltransferase
MSADVMTVVTTRNARVEDSEFAFQTKKAALGPYVAQARDALVLNQLFVLPPDQGKGIGTVCIQRLIDEARSSSLPIRLRVLKVNTRAVAFYERSGFRRVGEIATHVLMERGA